MADPDLLAAVAGFARTLRACGVTADLTRTRTAAEALEHVDLGERSAVHAALAATLIGGPADRAPFDMAFELYFGRLPEAPPPRVRRAVVQRPWLVAIEAPGTEEAGPAAPAVGVASEHEVLRDADLAALTDEQRRAVRRLIAALRPGGPARPSRRRRPARRGELDRVRTSRATLRRGAEPALRYHRRADKPRRLVLLVDISGSMTPYADAYLRFAHVAVRRRPTTEVFTIGTRLTRVSRRLAEPDPDTALQRAASAIPDWSGGTRLGAQLRAFNARWGQRGTARGAVVVIFSDGWERGDASLLGAEAARLHRLAHRLIWVNPHRGREGFVPATAGMQAVLPYLDTLHEGHTLGSLEALCAEVS